MGVYYDKTRRKWIAQVSRGERYSDGRIKYKKVSAETKKEAEERELELKLELQGIKSKLDMLLQRQQQEAKTCTELFKDVAQRWLMMKKDELARSTWDRYRVIVESHLIPKFGDRQIDNITTDEIRFHLAGGSSQSDKGQHFFVLRNIFRSLQLKTMENVKIPKQKSSTVECITDPAALAKLVEAMKGSTYHIAVAILAATGM